jgi:hypothetical protein
MVAKQWALVIGNAESTLNDSLQSSTRDADAIAKKLIELQFEVLPEHNLDLKSTIAARLHFMQQLITYREKTNSIVDLALVFYSGHGLSHNNQHYMIPTDYNPAKPYEISFLEYIEISSFVSELEKHARVVIVLFDGCRSSITKEFERDLHKVFPAVPQPATIAARQDDTLSPTGKFILFSTVPGGVPFDGAYAYNRPFCQAFLDNIDRASDDIVTLANRMRMDVRRFTNYKENIDYVNGLSAPFFFIKEAEKDGEKEIVVKEPVAAPVVQEVIPAPTYKTTKIAASLAAGITLGGSAALLLPQAHNLDKLYQPYVQKGEPVVFGNLSAGNIPVNAQVLMSLSDLSRLSNAADGGRNCPLTTADSGWTVQSAVSEDMLSGSAEEGPDPLTKSASIKVKGKNGAAPENGDLTSSVDETEIALVDTPSEARTASDEYISPLPTRREPTWNNWVPTIEYIKHQP